MSTLNDLPPAALAAVMRQGNRDGWEQYGSAIEHVRYAQPVQSRSRRLCHCGCKKRATYMGMANGMALMSGCELQVRRWVKSGRLALNPRGDGGVT